MSSSGTSAQSYTRPTQALMPLPQPARTVDASDPRMLPDGDLETYAEYLSRTATLLSSLEGNAGQRLFTHPQAGALRSALSPLPPRKL